MQNQQIIFGAKSYLEQSVILLEREKIIANQILLSKLWYVGQIYTIPKCIKKKTAKRIYKIYNFLWNNRKGVSRHLVKLSIWKDRLGIFDKDTQWSSLQINRIQGLLNPTNALRKDLMLQWLNLILKSKQGLTLFRQIQILSPARCKILQKQNNEEFFIQLFNA